MTDRELAQVIVDRLNGLLEDHAAAIALEDLVATRIVAPLDLESHPTIQVRMREDGAVEVGFLGMLNGIVGAIALEGPREGWGYVAANFQDGRLVGFKVLP